MDINSYSDGFNQFRSENYNQDAGAKSLAFQRFKQLIIAQLNIPELSDHDEIVYYERIAAPGQMSNGRQVQEYKIQTFTAKNAHALLPQLRRQETKRDLFSECGFVLPKHDVFLPINRIREAGGRNVQRAPLSQSKKVKQQRSNTNTPRPTQSVQGRATGGTSAPASGTIIPSSLQSEMAQQGHHTSANATTLQLDDAILDQLILSLEAMSLEAMVDESEPKEKVVNEKPEQHRPSYSSERRTQRSSAERDTGQKPSSKTQQSQSPAQQAAELNREHTERAIQREEAEDRETDVKADRLRREIHKAELRREITNEDITGQEKRRDDT